MSVNNFFLRLISLCAAYIEVFLDLIFASPFFIPFCIVFGCGCLMLVYKFLRG